jgi:hypothetical protein
MKRLMASFGESPPITRTKTLPFVLKEKRAFSPISPSFTKAGHDL